MDKSILRGMAWQRAKGELLSILETYVGNDGDYKKAAKTVEDFVEKIEDEEIFV